MNPLPDPTPDAELRTLLRSAHPPQDLPPRFQEDVWRRLERDERPRPVSGWMASLLGILSRPAYASLGLALVMIVGVGQGLRDSKASSLRTAQARYHASVNPLRQLP